MAGPTRGPADYLALGDWNAQCSMCGRKRKASELVKNWQGQYRCPEHNEPRHPQDFVKGVADNPMPPWVQPIPADVITFGDPLITEISNTTEFDYILTENFSPLTTE